MNRTFTQDEIILFLYNELPVSRRVEFIKELSGNIELREELQAMAETLDLLNGPQFSPSETSVAIIIEDSLSSHLEMH